MSAPVLDAPARVQDRAPLRRPRPAGRRRWARVAVALAVGAAVAAAGLAADAARTEATVLGPGLVTVDVGIHHSRFELGDLRVRAGTVVRFVVRNDDPIDHELVVGEDAVHRRHAAGTEQRHPPVPGEVSVAPGQTALTFYEFDEPGTVAYACHLPGHAAYGMAREIEVVPANA